MLAFKTVKGLEDHLKTLENKDFKIGFVPTMGALHQGHISLVNEAKAICDITICSIFINPRQFNVASDLTNYPRTLEQDIKQLHDAGCDILFHPEADDIYSRHTDTSFDFEGIDGKLEGKHRPGHFDGVASIVHRLFDIVKPEHAFFRLKDYQQCMIVDRIVKQSHPAIKLHFCPIIREEDGLAMSSRNRRIMPEHRPQAAVIYQTLLQLKQDFNTQPLPTLKKQALNQLESVPEITVDYFEVVNAQTLDPASNPDDAENIIALVAVNIGGVRLIDNMFMKKQEGYYA